jgi:hypothetical protein
VNQVNSATLLAATAPSTTERALIVTGTLNWNGAGQMYVTGTNSSGGSGVTINVGAYVRVTPISAP